MASEHPKNPDALAMSAALLAENAADMASASGFFGCSDAMTPASVEKSPRSSLASSQLRSSASPTSWSVGQRVQSPATTGEASTMMRRKVKRRGTL